MAEEFDFFTDEHDKSSSLLSRDEIPLTEHFEDFLRKLEKESLLSHQKPFSSQVVHEDTDTGNAPIQVVDNSTPISQQRPIPYGSNLMPSMIGRPQPNSPLSSLIANCWPWAAHIPVQNTPSAGIIETPPAMRSELRVMEKAPSSFELPPELVEQIERKLERARKIQRFKAKKARFALHVRYTARQALAFKKCRYNGKFVSRQKYEAIANFEWIEETERAVVRKLKERSRMFKITQS